MRLRSLPPVLLVLFVLTGVSITRPPAPHFDLLLRGGKVLDGSGNPWFRADVGVIGRRIAAVGLLGSATADEEIDVDGLFITPGFVDLHSHAADVAWEDAGFDSPDPARRAAPNLVAQGVTTVAINHDGRSPIDLAAQRAQYEDAGIGINAVLMVGHGSVRASVLGEDYRRISTPDEIGRMRDLVRAAMESGAAGLSAGLEYAPGRWAETDEVVALMEEVAAFDGVYISHQRSEGADPMWYWPSQDSAGPPTLIDAVLETIEIGERTGARVVASHLKAKGAHYWGSSASAIQLIEAARARGVRVFGDQYPYTTSGSDGSTVLLPRWAFATRERGTETPDYASHVDEVARDPVLGLALRRDIEHEIRRRGGADRVVVLDAEDKQLVGRSLEEIADQLAVNPVEAAIWLQVNGTRDRRGGVHLRGYSMDELDVDAYAARDWVATASDAGIALPEDGPVHPRYWGTFPRKIRRYALERQVQTVADAVRSGTSLPAMLLGLSDRGLVREGLVADLAVLDLGTIRDHATAFDPHAKPDGIEHVILAGEWILRYGAATGALSGSVLRPGESP